MKINEVAKLTGVTVRTLHYYDEIGLLHPYRVTEAGYRIYNEESLETLQQILFFKELDFPLNQIKEIMTNPSYDKRQALNKHRELLLKKKERLDQLIKLVNNTSEGVAEMSFKEFDKMDVEEVKSRYAKEVKERWGSTKAYMESEEKASRYDKEKWKIINDKAASILQKFGENRHGRPNSSMAMELVREWQDFISSNFYHCTNEILSGLGLMYVEDERFTQSIDKYGEGTAEFMAKAIEAFVNQ